MTKWKEYLKDVISPSDNTSSRKFITLLISGIFLFAQTLITFFCFYLILYKTKGQVDKDLLDALLNILRYDFYIILSGLGFVTSSDLVRIIVSKGFGWKDVMNTDDEVANDTANDITEDIEQQEEQDLKKPKRKKKSNQAKISYD